MQRRDWMKTAACWPAAGGEPTARPRRVLAPPARRPARARSRRRSCACACATPGRPRCPRATYRETLHARFTRRRRHRASARARRSSATTRTRRTRRRRSRPRAPTVLAADPWRLETLEAAVFPLLERQYAARAALDIALHDWVGQRLGVPRVPPARPRPGAGAGHDVLDRHRHAGDHAQKVREAAEFPVLKVKVGLDTDEATIEAVRSVTDKPLRVDANEGWKDKETAVAEDRVARVARASSSSSSRCPRRCSRTTAWLKARSPDPHLRRRGLPARQRDPRAWPAPTTAST